MTKLTGKRSATARMTKLRKRFDRRPGLILVEPPSGRQAFLQTEGVLTEVEGAPHQASGAQAHIVPLVRGSQVVGEHLR